MSLTDKDGKVLINRGPLSPKAVLSVGLPGLQECQDLMRNEGWRSVVLHCGCDHCAPGGREQVTGTVC